MKLTKKYIKNIIKKELSPILEMEKVEPATPIEGVSVNIIKVDGVEKVTIHIAATGRTIGPFDKESGILDSMIKVANKIQSRKQLNMVPITSGEEVSKPPAAHIKPSTSIKPKPKRKPKQLDLFPKGTKK